MNKWNRTLSPTKKLVIFFIYFLLVYTHHRLKVIYPWTNFKCLVKKKNQLKLRRVDDSQRYRWAWLIILEGHIRVYHLTQFKNSSYSRIAHIWLKTHSIKDCVLWILVFFLQCFDFLIWTCDKFFVTKKNQPRALRNYNCVLCNQWHVPWNLSCWL